MRRIMRVYLINMPFFEQEYTTFSEKWEYIEDEYLGVGIVQKILENEGCEVIVNRANSIKEMVFTTHDVMPDVVMISVMQTSARLTYRFVNELRKSGWNGKIFIGGWFAKMAWREILIHKWDVDYVCYCDAEMVLDKWIRNPDKFIVGIVTKNNYDQHDKISINELRQNNDWPARYVESSRIKGRNTYCIETSRGCPHSFCTFCSQSCGNIINNKWTPLPLEIVKGQIIELHNKYGATRFSTTDDDLLGPIENVEERARIIHDLIINLPFKITFSASISVKAATNGTVLDLLQDAGLEQLCVGFESADEQQLRRYGKQQSLEDNYLAAREVRNRNIPMLPGLITFDPFATKDTVEKNLKFLFEELGHYDLGKLTKKLHILTGTPMVKMIRDAGLLRGDYLYYDYEFKNEEASRLYEAFISYTEKVKDIQKQANYKKMQHNKTLGIHHRNVAEAILNNSKWEDIANSEINQMIEEMRNDIK